MVNALLINGASIQARTKLGRTPLHIASAWGNVEVVEALIARGADINARDIARMKLGCTPLHIASAWGNVEVVEALIARGADINARDNVGESPLFPACARGRVRVVEALFTNGADIDATKDDGLTALHYVCSLGNVEVVNMLLAKGAKVEATAANGLTPLHYSCNQGHVEVVEALLAKGANIGAMTVKGWTPMNYACLSGRVEVVEILLSKGADTESRDSEGKTPLDMAKSKGTEAIVNILSSYTTAVVSPGHTTNSYTQNDQSVKIDVDNVSVQSTSPSPVTNEHHNAKGADLKEYTMDSVLSLTDDDILFLRKGQQLLKDVDVIPSLSEQEKVAMQTLTTNLVDFERSLESVRELPALSAHMVPEVSTYFFFFPQAFERMMAS
jgi:ankyrin repeat protein